MKFLSSIAAFIVFSVTVKAQTLNYYYGNLHSHTGYSDGNKDAATSGVSTPAGSYAYAKLSQNFDFLGISEHNHFSSTNNPGMLLANYALGLSQAAAATTSTFLAMYGMEWGVSTQPNSGHVLIFGFNQLIGWETVSSSANYDIYNDKLDYDGLFRKVANNPNAFCTLAHPGSTDFGNLSNISYSITRDSAIVGSVFRNGLATSAAADYTTYPATDYSWYYRKLLSAGYHLGISYDHDNHYTNFGRGNAGRLVIMAPSLTEANLIQAMQKMHFYASEDWNCKIDFKINTSIMGDSTSGLNYPTINVVHNDDDGELADSIKIWSGVEGSGIYSVVSSVVKNSNTLSFTDNTMAPGSNKYYFAEIRQADGQRIITSPIWYRVSNYVGIKENKNETNFLVFPNPVHSKLFISTNTCDDFTVEISDVSGKAVYTEKFNENNIFISTEAFASGFYTVKINCKDYYTVKKLVIE